MGFDLEAVEKKIDRAAAGAIPISAQAGGIQLTTFSEAMELSKVMAVGLVSVPKFLRGNPSDCLSIIMQAVGWGLDPWAVARMAYAVNDIIGYQAQLLHALVLKRAPIKGRLKIMFTGEGVDRQCLVWTETREGERVDYQSPKIKDIKPKNSPLWIADPDQQLSYFSIRALSRRHFPDVLLGIYSEDELRDQHIGPERAKDVTPTTLGDRLKANKAKAKNDRQEQHGHGFDQEHIEREAKDAHNVVVIDERAEQQPTVEAAAQEAPAPEPEPAPAALDADPLQIALQKGAQAKRDGKKLKDLPKEYRKEGREEEAAYWARGFRTTLSA